MSAKYTLGGDPGRADMRKCSLNLVRKRYQTTGFGESEFLKYAT